MDGGGRCQQSELGRFGTDRECKCAFCTERQLESQFGECSRCALGSNRQPSSSPAASAVSRLQHHAGANSVSVMTNSPSGEGGRSTMACTSIKGNQIDVAPKASSIHCRSLLSLCVGYIGEHLEDLIDDIDDIAPAFPFHVKGKLLAIARRRNLLCDELLTALADISWEILDVSGSDVTDSSLIAAAQTCPRLQDVDISRCNKLTCAAVRALVEHCPNLRTLRYGGTPMSDAAARKSISYIVPKLNRNEEEDSWEVLETKAVAEGAQTLRWLVWPGIDPISMERLKSECPRIVINPVFSWKSYGIIPPAALRDAVLDESFLEDIDPKTWANKSKTPPRSEKVPPRATDEVKNELSVAEKFRLAFVARDERLAPKRAKNARQNQRRAEKAWLNSDTEAKSIVWAGIAQKSLKKLGL
ncbi:uncharacterized protein [Physcomitrium patens]|uniref:RNI-like superfamily protein n=1 Tax=Physcomitrium patens TaxID=3218 RepID=A0A2K1K3L6_PHYPA|nr:uncharacterized protein LOC112286692 [Physcomitrium patens]PNR48372.1 hypothetical protein PHYPA_012848 [Physcomitrium patens]|eukprot:XP_024384601.1 uncharacterized protein LOC112286692 [Physcomitrella patens]